MKSIKFILALFVIVSTLISCNENDTLDTLANTKMNPEEFFAKVAAMDIQTSDENVIYIDIKYDSEKNTIEYITSREAKPDFFVLDDEEEVKQRRAEDKYEVTCKGGTKEFTEGCNGKLSCGKLIYNCLQSGGCATICENKVIYVPQNKLFYIE